MPYSIAIERIAQQQLVRQSQGEDARHTQFLVGHAVAAGLQAEVLALPLSTEGWAPLQDVDPLSATFGMMYFIPDLDVPDSGQPML